MVLEAQKDSPPGRWIRGRGWDQNDWEKKDYPSWRDLDGTEANPVYLRRIDGHAAWVNKTALEVCGITRDTPDPPGGRILRDATGDPTGIFIDEATDLISDRIPKPDPDELDEWILDAIRECNRVGLVGIHDAGTAPEELEAFERLHGRGLLTLRLYCMLDSDEEAFLGEELRKGPRSTAGGRVVIRAIKVYADGALGSRGAALLEPYSDEPGNSGLIVSRPEKIERLSLRALEHGFQICTHAIGDRGVRMVLDAYEKALETHGVTDHRFRIEHSQVVSPDDIPRYRELGVMPSMQPTHATSDMYWAEDRVGPKRIKGAYAWRTFLDGGNRLPLGSDFPVESPDPLWGIYAAVTRQDHKGWPQGGWYPDQRLSVLEAVKGFTVEAAYAGFAEDETGTIEVGKLADFTILDKDIFTIPPADILRTTVTHTVVAGEIVYDSESADSP
jgi:predicted amidohydrolase YtcJ